MCIFTGTDTACHDTLANLGFPMQATSAGSLRGASTPDAQEAPTLPSSPLRAHGSSCASGVSAGPGASTAAPEGLPGPGALWEPGRGGACGAGGGDGSSFGAERALVEERRSRPLRGEPGSGAPVGGSRATLHPASNLPGTGMRRRGPNPFATPARDRPVLD